MVCSLKREAIILAGGFGTRLRSAVPDLPKVLAPVAGEPFLAHIFRLLEHNCFTRVVLAVGYRHEDVKAAFGQQSGNLDIVYSIEHQPLGTGGALWLAARQMEEGQDFFVLNGDTYADIDFVAMERAMVETGADITMAMRHTDDTGRYGLVEKDNNGIVTRFSEKTPGHAGLINAGVYLLRYDVPQRFPATGPFSLESDLLQARLGELRIVAVPMSGYFIDIGIPEDYERAKRELAAKT